MKKNIRLLIIILILIPITFILYYLVSVKEKSEKKEDYSGIKEYIKDIYGTTFLIPEFNDINQADEDWLWENVSQYVWNHDDEYHEKNTQEYGYHYEDIAKVVKTLYGNHLNKKFPKGATAMRYNSYRDLYGPTSFVITNYYDYRIDTITKNENIYTVSLFDFTVYLNKNENENNDFEIFNNYDFILNENHATPLLKISSLKDSEFKNILNKKEDLSHKILTIEYDEMDNLYHITSCKYEETKDTDILSMMYHKMQKTFEIMSIHYTYEDIYTQEEVIVTNFDELSSIYTETALPTYKEEMDIFVYKENGDVYITAGDITVGDYLIKVEFDDILSTENTITCNVIRTFRESFDPADESYQKTYQKENTFTIVNIDGTWFIDEFSYNKDIENALV